MLLESSEKVFDVSLLGLLPVNMIVIVVFVNGLLL